MNKAGLAIALYCLTATSFALETNTSTQQTGEKLMQAATNAQQMIQKGILIGKVESSLYLNQHLRGYKIDVEEDLGTFRLTGNVATSIEKDYAEQLLYTIDGVNKVINNIKVSRETQKKTLEDQAEKLTGSIKDISITGSIKAKLFANQNISGLGIEVSTHKGAVTLGGVAMSSIEKELIGMIAKNTPGVSHVKNNIQINESKE